MSPLPKIPAKVRPLAEAQTIAAKLTVIEAGTDYAWNYVAEPLESDPSLAKIAAYDETREFVEYLAL